MVPSDYPHSTETSQTRSTSTPEPRRHWRPALQLAAMLTGAALLLGSGAVPCAFAVTTGLPCPGCGSVRSLRAALVGDWQVALRLNPLGVVTSAWLVVGGLAALAAIFREGNLHRLSVGRGARRFFASLLLIAGLQVAIWLARFLGFFGGLVPV